MKTKRRSFTPGSLIAPMIDLFVLSLCFVLMKQPQFGLKDHVVPGLVVKKHDAHGPNTSHGPTAILKADGTALWNEQTVGTAELPRMIEAEAKKGQDVRVVVETASNGTGPARAMLELQMECGRLGVADHLRLLFRPHEESP